MMKTFEKRSGLNIGIWFLVGKKSRVISWHDKSILFPFSSHMPPTKRSISKVYVEFGNEE